LCHQVGQVQWAEEILVCELEYQPNDHKSRQHWNRTEIDGLKRTKIIVY